MITQVSADYFSFLYDLQTKLAKTIKSVGRIDHTEWRAFSTERKSEQSLGFVDGDLIETFLDLEKDKMAEIAQALQVRTFY